LSGALAAEKKKTGFLTPSKNPITPTPQSLLRALGLFLGGVVVARNFGDAFQV
jgi:hypothetical protein